MDPQILPWVVGLAAFLAGLIISYLIDLLFWRRKIRQLQERHLHTDSLLREQVDEAEHLRYQLAKFNESFDEYDRYTKKLEYDLESSRLELAEVRVQHEASDARARQFQTDVANLRRQVQTRDGNKDDSARQLERYKRALYDKVNENKLLTAQLHDYETKMQSLQQTDAPRLAAIDDGPSIEVYKPLEAASFDGDQLERISGIGSVYADRLRAAGIRTFADLSRMRAERLTDIIQPKKWQQIEPERWIAEAADFASPNGNGGELR